MLLMRLCSICSARPNFVKLAAIHHALNNDSRFQHTILHTGQHYDPLFSDIFFEQLDIPLPTTNLDIHGGTRDEVIEQTMKSCFPLFIEQKPDMVLVYGDVNGAVGAARAAKQAGCRIAHIEAGLRSFDSSMPEEVNRIEIDQLSDMLFVSEESGMLNLQEEKVQGKAFLVGNTMIDTLLRMMPIINSVELPQIAKKPYTVCTLHRPSNVDTKEALTKIIQFLGEIAQHIPILLPLHHRLRSQLEKFQISLPLGIHHMDPLGYVSFIRLLMDSSFILTDSGGIQEEAVLLQKRCFTLRKNTERPSTIVSGSNVLIDHDDQEDRKKVLEFSKNPVQPSIHIPELWDGRTGERIISQVLYSA